jgi:hypothetical protein
MRSSVLRTGCVDSHYKLAVGSNDVAAPSSFSSLIVVDLQISVLLHACVPCKEGVMTATRVSTEFPYKVLIGGPSAWPSLARSSRSRKLMPSACCFQTQHASHLMFSYSSLLVRVPVKLCQANLTVRASPSLEAQLPAGCFGCVGRDQQHLKCRKPAAPRRARVLGACAMQVTDAPRADEERPSGAVALTASSLQVTTVVQNCSNERV